MNNRADNDDPDAHRPLRRHPGVIAGLLVLAAAIIGLVAAFLDANSGSGETVIVTAPREPSEEGNPLDEQGTSPIKEDDAGEEASREKPHKSAPSDSLPRDGNSHGTAKKLAEGRQVHASLDAGNDVDWWVYRADSPQTAIVEVTKGVGNEEYGSIRVTIYEGTSRITYERLVAEEPSPVIRRSIPSGGRLFIEVVDDCGDPNPCGIGPYSIVVRAAPAG